ncbi:MAG TPA: alpha/beta hydrolase [Pseudomonas xinjiangensis]|uniref:Alpha/beta hydrolase n=2 Tax=root TaxID=1 RepID=A0A7V1BSI4_9GAMM|nr:alpha/beta hydrolase [Halopseudomonas xinjiangensis]HEC46965.1 alpha/beta hydrolase [Halopseudomonas xinjiangensis]
MEMLIGLVGLAILVVIYLRRYLLRKEIPAPQATTFNGNLFKVGEAVLARRTTTGASSSVVVVPGFVENFLYFTEFYESPDIELIKLTCSGYHVPVNQARFQAVDWGQPPAHPSGTIAYDAAVLTRALENLVTTDTVRVHGHSRGGAVVLEAARQRPDLFEKVEVVLEAPVLPQGKPYKPMPPIARWFMPFVLVLWQQNPISDANRKTWGPLDNPRKRELIMGYPFNARRCSTLVANLKDMASWMENTGFEIYRNVKRGAIVVPAKDKVLNPAAMLASARQADNLRVIEIPDCSHFVVSDSPHSIPPLLQA